LISAKHGSVIGMSKRSSSYWTDTILISSSCVDVDFTLKLCCADSTGGVLNCLNQHAEKLLHEERLDEKAKESLLWRVLKHPRIVPAAK